MRKIDDNTYEIAGEKITVGATLPIQTQSEEYKWVQDMMKLSEEALLRKYKEKVKSPKEEDKLSHDCTKCESCHGTGKGGVCPDCGGEKILKCQKCKGHGQFSNCLACNSTGKVKCHVCHGSRKTKCSHCEGTGKDKECPVCNGEGKVEKTRLVNCPDCHGSGRSQANYSRNCPKCSGTGRIEQKYKDICPNCNGLGFYGATCHICDGTGSLECVHCDDGIEVCSKCGGNGHAKCSECGGTGKAKCKTCGGKGNLDKCPDCERRKRARRESIKWKSAILMCVDKKLAAGGGKTGSKSVSAMPRRKKFMLLGLFLGFFGVHFAYAKRWVLFALLWVCWFGNCVTSDAPVEKTSTAAQILKDADISVEELEVEKDASLNIWNLTAMVLWFGGALFIKKDGKGKPL